MSGAIAPNGRKERANGKHSAEGASGVAPEVQAAPFAGIRIEPIDAPMWPIHPTGWFQPEAQAAVPSWNGLNIERRYRIPAPDLVRFPLVPFDCPAELDLSFEVRPPAVRPQVPESDLELLGWDPRAVSPKKELK